MNTCTLLWVVLGVCESEIARHWCRDRKQNHFVPDYFRHKVERFSFWLIHQFRSLFCVFLPLLSGRSISRFIYFLFFARAHALDSYSNAIDWRVTCNRVDIIFPFFFFELEFESFGCSTTIYRMDCSAKLDFCSHTCPMFIGAKHTNINLVGLQRGQEIFKEAFIRFSQLTVCRKWKRNIWWMAVAVY